jgi:hypothetical protein
MIISVVIVRAETTPDEGIAARMAKDLLPATSALTLPDPIRDEIYFPEELKSLSTASLRKVMDAYQQDVRELEWKHNRLVRKPDEATLTLKSFTSADQAYKLAHALVGKDVTEASLIRVCDAIARLVKASVECRNVACEFREDSSARNAAEGVRTALQ